MMYFNPFSNRFYLDDYFTRTFAHAGLLVAAIALIIVLIGLVIYLIAKVRLFRNCGKQGWKAIIPFYGSYVFYCEICGLHWAWFVAKVASTLLSFNNTVVGILEIFINAMAFHNFALRTRKDNIPAMIFGGLVPSIMTVIYGFSTFYYEPTIEVKNSGLF